MTLGTDDFREAPSLVNIPLILEEGGRVKAYDPVGAVKFKKILTSLACEYETNIMYCNSAEEALEQADICFIFTEWDQIKALTKNSFAKMKRKLVLDGRNCYSINSMQGIEYESIGRNS